MPYLDLRVKTTIPLLIQKNGGVQGRPCPKGPKFQKDVVKLEEGVIEKLLVGCEWRKKNDTDIDCCRI